MFQILHCEAQSACHFWRVLLCFGSEAFGAASRPWSMVHGPWSMDHGPWTMGHGPWIIVHGPWTMDHGPWSMVHGPYGPWSIWTMVHGPLSMSHGLWAVDHGSWSMPHGPWTMGKVFHWKAQNARQLFGVWFGALQWRLCCSELRGFKRGFAPLERLNT